MKKAILFTGISLMLCLALQAGYAQQDKKTIAEALEQRLKKVTQKAREKAVQQTQQELESSFRQYGYEIIKITPCVVHIKKSVSEDTCTDYTFAPNKASWDAGDFGIRADWTIIREKKSTPRGETIVRNAFILPLADSNKAAYVKIVEQINTLSQLCRLPVRPHEITDHDLALFLKTEQAIDKETMPLREQLIKDLAGYHTDPGKLNEIYLMESYDQNLDDYSEKELAEEAKVKPVLKAYSDKYLEIYNHYFESEWAGMPEKQFIAIGDQLISDKALLERAKKVRKIMKQEPVEE